MEHRGNLPDISIPDVSLYELVFDTLDEADAARVAVVHEDGRALTFAEVKRDVDAVATWLAAQGVGPGDAVAIDLPNCPEYLSAFHGIARAGAAVTPVNAAYVTAEIARQLRETRASHIVTNAALLDKVSAAAALVGLPEEAVIVVGDDIPAGFTPYAELLATEPAPPVVEIEPATHLVALPFSSGTSGLPKAVMLSHRNLVANLLQFNEVLTGFAKGDSLVAFLPYSHIYALTTNLNFGLFRRFTQYTLTGFNPQVFLTTVATHRPTMLFIVPPVAAFLAKHPAVAGVPWDSVRLVVSGAAPMDGPVGAAIEERLGCRVIQGYGMTELSPVTHVIPLDRPDIDLGTIGLAIPNVRFRVVDPTSGEDVAVPDEGWSAPGELWCTGPNAMLGYLGVPKDVDAVLVDGWVHTGDLVVVDARGAVRVVDRIKELIKRRGFQVAPAELEALLCTHPAVADAGVTGVASTTPGEQIPHALVQLRPDAEVSEHDLAHWLAGQVASYKRLGGVTFVEKVPRSAAGKILRRELPALLPPRS